MKMETNNVKLTDNEIIKVWAKCLTDNEDCSKCPLLGIGCHEQILDILNRQKAENERLRNSGIRANSVDDWLKHCNELRTEAAKEFANELKCRTHEISYNTMQVVNKDDIDNLLKEMVGEDK